MSPPLKATRVLDPDPVRNAALLTLVRLLAAQAVREYLAGKWPPAKAATAPASGVAKRKRPK